MSGVSAFAQDAPEKSGDTNSSTGFALVEAKLEQSEGKLTPEVRAAYLDWAQQEVLRRLSDSKQIIPADCLLEVQADSTLRDALFGAIGPPDPSILQNYAQLRSELGAEFTAKYRSLVIAVAVVTRTHGAKKLPLRHIGSSPEPKEKSQDNAVDLLPAALGMFMVKNNLSALDLYQKPEARASLPDFLRSEHFDEHKIAEINDPSRLLKSLKQAMVLLGQKPAHRTPSPDMASWLRYLVSIYEAKPADLPEVGKKKKKPEPWPRFPMGMAPWPLLMPLYHPYPLDEARYIWEKYQGQHGSDYYHTYGPYRMGESKVDRELKPSSWDWNAWPDVIVHGGNCTVMAPMAVETHITLVEPAVMAGQPGHSNLLSYKNDDGFWWLDIEQAFAGGPKVTWGTWLFNEVGKAPCLSQQNGEPWAQVQYHLGLAQAMNVDLPSYIDTRIAMNIYRQLSNAQKTTLGSTLLTQATQTNPFNPEPWHFLAKQTVDAKQGLELVKRAMASEQYAFPGRGRFSTYPKKVKESLHAYWDCLIEHLVSEAILSHPVLQDVAFAKELSLAIKPRSDKEEDHLMPYRLQAENAQPIESELMTTLSEHVKKSLKENKGKAKKQFEAKLKAFLAATSKEEGNAFLALLKSYFSPDDTTDPYLKLIEAAQAGR